MSDCCSSTAGPLRLTPHACFERGLATRRLPALPLRGARLSDTAGRWVEFSAVVDDAGRLSRLRFACASCTTLIACCQALLELNRGCPAGTPCVTEALQLLRRLPGLPAGKHDRACLAVAAFVALLPVTAAAAAAPATCLIEETT